MARTFKATLTLTRSGKDAHGRIPLTDDVVADLGLQPGESLRASLRGTEFTGKVAGSLKSPSLLVPIDVVHTIGLRDGQGVRLTVIGRA